MSWVGALVKEEVTLFSIITNLMHFGMTIVGLPYSFQGQMALDEVVGGSSYGATTIAGGQGQRQPSAIELEGARFQGKLIAETANKLLAERRPTHKDVMGLIAQSVIARGKSRTTQGHADPTIISVNNIQPCRNCRLRSSIA